MRQQLFTDSGYFISQKQADGAPVLFVLMKHDAMIRLFKSQQQIIVHAQPFKWLLIFGEGSPANVFLRTESGFADLRPGGNGGVSGESAVMNGSEERRVGTDCRSRRSRRWK